MSNGNLIAAFNREVGNSGWVGARGAYLIALRDEFDKRGFDYSIISGKGGGLSLKTKIKLIGKRIALAEY